MRHVYNAALRVDVLVVINLFPRIDSSLLLSVKGNLRCVLPSLLPSQAPISTFNIWYIDRETYALSYMYTLSEFRQLQSWSTVYLLGRCAEDTSLPQGAGRGIPSCERTLAWDFPSWPELLNSDVTRGVCGESGISLLSRAVNTTFLGFKNLFFDWCFIMEASVIVHAYRLSKSLVDGIGVHTDIDRMRKAPVDTF